MRKIEKKLTLDDLIIEYIIFKTENGYEPSCTITELFNFLNHFKETIGPFYLPSTELKIIEEAKTPEDREKLITDFIERKSREEWSGRNFETHTLERMPHLDLTQDQKQNEFILKANYRLMSYDKKYINEDHMNQYELNQIKTTIQKFLSKTNKRQINLDEYHQLTQDEKTVGSHIALEIVKDIWTNNIENYQKQNKWPIQCKDFEKYLLDIDLAKIIGLSSIKQELLEIYKTVSKKISIMYHHDKFLQISNAINGYLSYANYQFIKQDYEALFESAFNEDFGYLRIDLSKKTYEEKHYTQMTNQLEIRNKKEFFTKENLKSKKLILKIENPKQ